MLAEMIAEQAENYFFARVIIFRGIADHDAVTAESAVDGAIHQLFDSEFFTPKQLAKLYRRLHTELRLQMPARRVLPNRELQRAVLDALSAMTRERIEKRASTTYDEVLERREELARELTVHPDLTYALA